MGERFYRQIREDAMDSLIIQDGFEPYYADRRPFRVALKMTRRRVEASALEGDRQAVPVERRARKPASLKGNKDRQ